MHGDDGFDRSRQAQETHYFHCSPPCELEVPAGAVTVTVQHGFATKPWTGTIDVEAGRDSSLRAELVRQELPPGFGRFVSADLHVHMNYGGQYRNTPEHLAAQAEAEDLNLVYNVIVNKEERVPDIARFRPGKDPASRDNVVIMQAQEFHTSFWGHLGLLYLSDHLITPDFAAYRHTAMASPYPYNGVIADLAHAQGGLVGYVHPFDFPVVPDKEKSLSHELPADVIEGKVDYLEIVAFSDHRATADVWYRLLNLGFRLPAGAGTDAMANYASLRGPVGLNRVFLDTGGSLDPEAARVALKDGRSFASNGPLLGLEIGGAKPGDTLKGGTAREPGHTSRSRCARRSLSITSRSCRTARCCAHSRYLGTVAASTARATSRSQGDGWILLRAWNDHADPLVLDIYPYATTSPVYVEGFGPRPDARNDAAYFVTWLDRTIDEARARSDDYNDDREKQSTLDYLARAREAYAVLAADRGRK